MRKLFFNMVCTILLIAVGCSPEYFVDEQKADGQVTDDKPAFVTLTTSMPEEGPRTRISLERENLDIKLKWEEGDQLELCLKYGEAIEKQVTTVTNISADGKTADFPVELPAGDYETFDLYGVYGGGGLDGEYPTRAILPSAATTTSGSLDELKVSKTVMLTFAKTGIERVSPDLSVDLKHMGSLFCIQLRNRSSSSWDNIKKVQLSAESPIYAHTNTGSAFFDLTTGTFSGTTSENELTFELSSATDLAAGGLQEFWGWYPPVSDQNWPTMSLKVIDGSEEELAQSVNSKLARTTTTPAGRAFYFPAVYDGTELEFVSTTPLTDIDGNEYTTVVIGDLEWMAENLRVTRYRNGDPINTGLSDQDWANTYTDGRVGAYAVYPYTMANGVVASEEEMIAKYGLLYNGYAIKDSRGLAPEGWRVATDEDYKKIELAIGFTEEQTNATNWRGVGSLKLRSTTGWPVNAGTDDFGFKALPAGCREQTGSYNYFNVRANFWTSTLDDAAPLTRSYRRILEDTRWNVLRGVIADREGYSIRCVRDI